MRRRKTTEKTCGTCGNSILYPTTFVSMLGKTYTMRELHDIVAEYEQRSEIFIDHRIMGACVYGQEIGHD
jgi:hypothetical protein